MQDAQCAGRCCSLDSLSKTKLPGRALAQKAHPSTMEAAPEYTRGSHSRASSSGVQAPASSYGSQTPEQHANCMAKHLQQCWRLHLVHKILLKNSRQNSVG